MYLMKNKVTRIIVFSFLILVLFAVQLFVMGEYPFKSCSDNPSPVIPSNSDVSHTDVSFSDAPAVSECDSPSDIELPPPEDIPVVIELQDLAGTDTAKGIKKIASEHAVAGLTVAVIKDGQIAYHYEYGYADTEDKRPVTVNTKFRIASLSKVFTSMMAMKLSEDGKLNLDRHIGGILGLTVRHPKYKKTDITTRMLLTHTASFDDKNPIFSTYLQNDLEDKNVYTPAKPGTKFHYNNFGMGVAGAVVEKASGMKLTDYAQSAFFDPMGVDAGYDGTKLEDRKDVADCMLRKKVQKTAEELVKKKETRSIGRNHSLAAGGLLISAVDMAKVTSILINGGVYDGQRYLSEETVATIHTPHIETGKFTQCIGIRRSDKLIPDRTMYYHTGAAYGIFSLMAYDIEDGSGVVILSTGSLDYSDSNGVRTICSEIMELVYEDLI